MNCPACQQENVDSARYCAKCGALIPIAHLDESDPLIGAIVGGRFRIVGLLGEGGMGRVYTAEQQMGSSVRKVAVKTLLEEFSRDPDVQSRFNRECGTVSELEHPNTIKFYDFGRTDTGDLYIAMEMVDGLPLSDTIEKDGALHPQRVVKVMRQVCGSLQEAHDKGIIHRDLKPDNIILTKRAGEADFAKVLDFGIAKRSDEGNAEENKKLTQAGTVLGTPPYMSPEQFTAQELDGRSDIYSLGVIAYEMLAGALPFKANTPWEWATKHMTAQPSPFEQTSPMAAQIPPDMKATIMRSLSKNRNDRQATASDFSDELAAALTTSQRSGLVGYVAGGASPTPAGAGGSRPGATQIGEPFIPPGGAQSSTPPAVSAPPMTGGGGAPPIPAPPTYGGGGSGGGGGGNKIGLIIGVAALATALVIGTVVAIGSSGGDEDESDPEIIDVTATSAAPIESSEPPDVEEPTTASGGGGSENTPPEPTATTPKPQPAKTTTKPPTRPTATTPKDGTGACNAAIGAALAGRCSQARGMLGKCSGHRRSIAVANVRRCKKK